MNPRKKFRMVPNRYLELYVRTVVHDCGISLFGRFLGVFILAVGPFTENSPRSPGRTKASVCFLVFVFLWPTQFSSKTGSFFEVQRS